MSAWSRKSFDVADPAREDERRAELERERRRRHPERSRLVKYNLSVDDFTSMQKRGKTCAICNEAPAPGKKLFIDHNHETQQVRGLLCNHCNSAIGFLRDSPTLARKAARYLECHHNAIAEQPRLVSVLTAVDKTVSGYGT
jgi:Recombination endonuclease VII